MDNRVILLFYKLRFLIFYTVIGFFSLNVENYVRVNLINFFGTNVILSNLISVSSSIAVAYFLNVNFNFKVPKERIKISLFYFTLISFFSCVIQLTFSYVVDIEFFQNRFQISGALFLIAYFLHRRYTFKNYQKIGVAIHLNQSNYVDEIYKKVKNFPDFIHIDLIDETINKKNISTDVEKLIEIRKFWPQKKLQIHIMSTKPEYWVDKLNSKILKKNFIPGIVLHKNITNIQILDLFNLFNNFMVLCVSKPGFSGQAFQQESTDLINNLVKATEQIDEMKITLDGGISPKIASRFNVKEVVSASSILNVEDSKKQIINFQTSQKYENPTP
jgi:pentose-5-phosphate-3-epimerase/putative flippase GtrA